MLDAVNASPGLVATNTAADGEWAFKTLNWTADAGGNLGIRFTTTAAGAWMDAVSVEVTPIPEPSSAALLAGCFGLTWVMLRRR